MRVLTCARTASPAYTVHFMLCDVHVDAPHLAGCFLVNHLHCYYDSDGLYVPTDYVSCPSTVRLPLRLRVSPNVALSEWAQCAQVVRSICSRDISAATWVRNLHFALLRTPPVSLFNARRVVYEWNAAHHFYVPQLRLSWCPENASVYLIVLPACDGLPLAQHSRMFMFWEHAMHLTEEEYRSGNDISSSSSYPTSVPTSDSTTHVVCIQNRPPRVSPGKWHRVPLMVIRDRAHPSVDSVRCPCIETLSKLCRPAFPSDASRSLNRRSTTCPTSLRRI